MYNTLFVCTCNHVHSTNACTFTCTSLHVTRTMYINPTLILYISKCAKLHVLVLYMPVLNCVHLPVHIHMYIVHVLVLHIANCVNLQMCN